MEKTREEILELTEEIFFIFMEHLSESDAKKFIEDDPDTPKGTRNTDEGIELYAQLEFALLRKLNVEI
jgi:hypothetical protein|tara:strand:- start:23 stop:226 length:204 start_codon:yes stop_codon:yes gene_type:complete